MISDFSEIFLKKCKWKYSINSFHATDPFWYPLKTSENLWFSYVFKRYQKTPVAWNGLKIHWRPLTILKTSKKCMKYCVKSVQIWSYFWPKCGKIRTRNNSVFGHFPRSEILFLICKIVYILKVYSRYIYEDKIQMLKKFSSDKINVAKNVLFFLSWVPTHHSFTFNSRFLYELKLKVYLSKSVCGISHFLFRFVFVRVYIFV